MTDKPDYRLYLEDKFDNLEKTLDRIEKHLEKQNGSIARLQEENNKGRVIIEDFRHLSKEFDCVKERVEKIDKDLLEIWFFKKYPKVFMGFLAFIVSVILGLSIWNKNDNKEIKRDVDHINSYLKIPYAATRSAVEINTDTLNKNKTWKK